MNRIILAAAMAALLVFSAGSGFGTENDQGPKVFFPQTHYEFSAVLEDTTVVHEFVIQNKGDAPLTVERVKTG